MSERVSDKMCNVDVRRRSCWTLLRVVGIVYLTLSVVTVHGATGSPGDEEYKYHKVSMSFLLFFRLSTFGPNNRDVTIGLRVDIPPLDMMWFWH